MSGASNSFITNIQKLTTAQSVYEEIRSDGTCEEIRLIILHIVPYARKFSDGVRQWFVDKYKPGINVMDCARLAAFLETQTSTKKKTVFDLMTVKLPEHTHLDLGSNQFQFHKGELVGQKTSSVGGVIGISDGRQTLATILSACTAMSMKKQGGQKEVVFHRDNNMAPSPVLAAFASQVVKERRPVAADVDALYKEIVATPVNDIEKTIEAINPILPKVKVQGTVTPIIQFKMDGPKLVMSRPTPTSQKFSIIGEQDVISKHIETYQMGTKSPSFKRVAKGAWVGAPIEALPCEEVITLHDAGVKASENKNILVVSSDGNMLTMLRSNFGPGVRGIGTGPFMMRTEEARRRIWDYVYYPKPFILNNAGGFEKSMLALIEKMKKSMECYAKGTSIFYVSPMAFYCAEFCEALGLVPGQDKTVCPGGLIRRTGEEISEEFFPSEDNLFKESDVPYIKIKKKIKEIKGGRRPVEAEVEKQVDIGTEVEVAQFFEKYPTLYHKLCGIRSITLLSGRQVKDMTVPLTTSCLSYRGVALYAEGRGESAMIPFSDAVGDVMYAQRETFKYLWAGQSVSKKKYKIRFFAKNALLDGITFSDEYSAMYTTEQIETYTKLAVTQVQTVVNEEVVRGEVTTTSKSSSTRSDVELVTHENLISLEELDNL